MNEDKKEKYIELIVTLATLLFFAFLSTYAMRGCSDNHSLDENLVAVLGTPSVSTNTRDKEEKDEVQAIAESDEIDESCDDESYYASEEVESSAEMNDSVAVTEEEATVNENTSAIENASVIEVVQEEVKAVESNESKVNLLAETTSTEPKSEPVKVEEKSSIIADIENERISKSPYVLEGVSFKTGSSILTKTSKKQLDTIANTLKKHKKVKINLRGHTDNMGSTKDNEVLSTERANSVGFSFVDRGVDINNIWIQGMGELDPIIKNGTAEEMAKNRRVDIAVME